jgi:hypothetical protein
MPSRASIAAHGAAGVSRMVGGVAMNAARGVGQAAMGAGSRATAALKDSWQTGHSYGVHEGIGVRGT